MDLTQIVRFIYEHAWSFIDEWNDWMLGQLNQPVLTSDGFRIVAPDNPDFWVGMRESQDTIFVSVKAPDGNYSSMARGQEQARTIYNQMVDSLLAA
jgi:hypothetical protein